MRDLLDDPSQIPTLYKKASTDSNFSQNLHKIYQASGLTMEGFANKYLPENPEIKNKQKRLQNLFKGDAKPNQDELEYLRQRNIRETLNIGDLLDDPSLIPTPLKVELEPTIIPKATVGVIPLLAPLFNTVTQPPNPLTVYPGEPGVAAKVKLENHEASSVRLRVLVRGNFPELWCQLLPENSQSIANQTNHSYNSNLINSITIEIPARGKWYGELRFDIPDDFIEDWQAIKSGNQEPSKLDWEGSIAVEALHSYDRESEPKLIEWIDFNLYVRPPAHEKYIGQLPELFQIRDFENRFISIFQQALNPIVNSFNSMWAYLDPLTCPQALLPFLGYWVGWTYQADWGLKQQRRLIRQAMKLYRWRGTRKGLRLYLHLYTGLPLDDHIPQEADKHISITENFSSGMVLGSSYLGIDTVLGGGIPYHFTVRLRLESKAVDEQSVRRIIDSEKPAFCTYKLIIES